MSDKWFDWALGAFILCGLITIAMLIGEALTK